MGYKLKSFIFTLLLGLFSFHLNAQEVEMADAMRDNGKIYVVVAVIAALFIILAVYLFYLDRKLTKLEQKQK